MGVEFFLRHFMRKINRLLTIVSLCGILNYSCYQSDKFIQEDEDYLIYYGSRETTIDDINFIAHLKAHIPTNKFLLELETRNDSDSNFQLNYFQAALITKTGTRAYPITSNQSQTELNPGESIKDTLFFEPINNQWLYKQANLRGDFLDQYRFDPGSMFSESNEQKTIFFHAETDDFNKYLLEYGTDKQAIVWNIDNRNKELSLAVKNSLSKAINYFTKTAGAESIANSEIKDGSFQVTSNEIMMSGLVYSLKAHQLNNRFLVELKIVNHQSVPVSLPKNGFRIILGGEIIDVSRVEEKQSNPIHTRGTEIIEMRKGDRIGLTLLFDQLPTGSEEMVLSQNISIARSEIQLIKNIPLIPINPPTQALAQED